MTRQVLTIACFPFAAALVSLGFPASAHASGSTPTRGSSNVLGVGGADAGGAACDDGGDAAPSDTLHECSVGEIGASCTGGSGYCVAATCRDRSGAQRDCALCLPSDQLDDPACAAGEGTPCGDGTSVCTLQGGGDVAAFASDCSIDMVYYDAVACEPPAPAGYGGNDTGGGYAGGSNGSAGQACSGGFLDVTPDPQAGPKPPPCKTSCDAAGAGLGGDNSLGASVACLAALAVVACRRSRLRARPVSVAREP